MTELKKHEITVSYTKRVNERSTVSTNVEQTPIELAHRALLRFFEDQYPWEHEIPEVITVDGHSFSYEEVRNYGRNMSNR